ncbi:MAG: PD40 domain-containing protein [Gemmatimonadota bacterium]|nr:MAG: PD40 domain-containing protein [Gemmatimonadota bacterium]
MTDTVDRLKAALADRYTIERELGSGGMATVYLAEDVKHRRKIAVKVLRPELAAALGADRFHREIEIAANLHHPHILPLYDSGDADGFLYYVMPYEEGQSLRDKLAKEGELPIPEAVRILRDVVDALDHAHKHGVVHRDIKPDNVLLTERHALVTDFGVAKAVSEATGVQKLTTEGVALGTPAYMSPEQAAADKHIDHRADIYAVGAVAYELLTGRPPFMGTTPQEVLAAHVTKAVEPVTEHRGTVPPALAQLVMKCLEKKPADRWQSAEQLLPELEAMATPSGGMTPTDTQPVPAISGRKRLVGLGVGILTIAVIVGVLLLRSESEMPLFRVGNTTRITRAFGLEIEPALSPDGRMVSYAAGAPDAMHIYVQQAGGPGTLALTQQLTGHHRSPRWLPDATRLVYESQGEIFMIPQLGGTPQRVIDRSPGPPGTGGQSGWYHSPALSPDGERIACVWQEVRAGTKQREPSEILVLPLSGGDATKVTDAIEAHSLRWSPDGSMLAFVSGAQLFVFGAGDFGNVDPSSIYVVRSSGGEPLRVTSEEHLDISPVWWPDGRHLLFVSNREGSRDVYQLAITGSGQPQGMPIRLTTGLEVHGMDLSADGTRLSYSVFTDVANLWSLEIPSAGTTSIGDAALVTNENQVIEFADLSTDGSWWTFDSNRDGNQNIYRMPVGGGEPQQLTTHLSDDYRPRWSPSGEEIAFYSLRTGNRDVYVMSADGRSLRQLTYDPALDAFPEWSPTGDAIVFHSRRTGRSELYLVTRQPGEAEWSAPEQLTTVGASFPDWSPDGSEIAYSGIDGIWALSLETRESRLLVDAQEGSPVPTRPRWSEDGDRVYYVLSSPEVWMSIWSVAASGGPTRLVADFDVSAARAPGPAFIVRHGHLYFSIHEFEADLYVAELFAR